MIYRKCFESATGMGNVHNTSNSWVKLYKLIINKSTYELKVLSNKKQDISQERSS